MKAFFRHENVGLLFALPAVVYMLIFVGYPIVHNIILGFQDVDVMNFLRGQKHFVGFENYAISAATFFCDALCEKWWRFV
jgi:multiple sugar transport system permease protein